MSQQTVDTGTRSAVVRKIYNPDPRLGGLSDPICLQASTNALSPLIHRAGDVVSLFPFKILVIILYFQIL